MGDMARRFTETDMEDIRVMGVNNFEILGKKQESPVTVNIMSKQHVHKKESRRLKYFQMLWHNHVSTKDRVT